MGTQMGGPGGGRKIQKPIPPERGSFPLDHDAECKSFMTSYLSCIRTHRGQNATPCRLLSKEYLECRMTHNLMAPDEMRNLGYGEEFERDVKRIRVGTGGSVSDVEAGKPPDRKQDDRPEIKW
ncbi:hypothetical protein EJ05DRAFT_472900 [Pseudovirgaria hyperparasitica]|uniref:CHCH domain-containing protein n=1 Tax=Pseudovirgaria hyperparasitica TaxID=470096 RepID=A0A6A6WGN4_9PEZI|nr:uncharacterized protein EJ05DRAFT_472900 [Pseudovirgaria hyperparasitica]KAF2761953.1 hypothetical protein EJ05DRAFT_472900 [Pseudovirgaria hyperparasitica]